MSGTLLFGFSLLLFFTTAQGILCNYCSSESPEKCRKLYKPCTPEKGRCFTETVYQGPKGKKYLFTRYGCVDQFNEGECGTLYMLRNFIYIVDCCNTEKCNTGSPRAPFPPANCTSPASGV